MNRCPKCKLYSSSEIDLCDCGFRFSTQSFDAKDEAIASKINKKDGPTFWGKSLLNNLTSVSFLSFLFLCNIYIVVEQHGSAFVSAYLYYIANDLGLFFTGPFAEGLGTLLGFYIISAILCFIPWAVCRLLKLEANFWKWVAVTKWVLLCLLFLRLLGR